MSDRIQYLNRELSWLDFNSRVLAIAEDDTTPLLERAKFLAIHSSNLDEFFQVRVAGIVNQIAAGFGRPGPDLMTPRQVLAAIREEASSQHQRQVSVFWDEIVPALAIEGIEFSTWNELDADDVAYLTDLYQVQMFPVLTPLAVDSAHPFPYISDRSLNLAVYLRHPDGGALQFARVKVPSNLDRLVALPGGERFIALENVIAAHLGTLFPGLEVVSHFAFRVTRDADLSINDDSTDDLLEEIENQLARRRLGEPVRLEVEEHIDTEALELLMRELDLSSNETYLVRGPLDMTALHALVDLDRPELKHEPYTPQIPPSFMRARAAGRSIFAMLRDHDVLVHHPYESFASSVEDFIAKAARDERVLAIKMTMYRTAEDSSIVRSLIEAAEAGKEVAVLVEIKARFDELANIEWARRLERAGVHVAHGLVGLKTHSKTALVVRQEGDEIRRYGHIATGNYNADTARIYEDMGLFTADPDTGADLTELFNTLTGYSAEHNYRQLVVAPHSVRASILELIDIESYFDDGHIVL
ncbi:MAG: polyphosphate kinase 1, partial [Actinobacteria bacterium]|nr:polyphosphate kinase 1 [Actinomycetota bacterium]